MDCWNRNVPESRIYKGWTTIDEWMESTWYQRPILNKIEANEKSWISDWNKSRKSRTSRRNKSKVSDRRKKTIYLEENEELVEKFSTKK